MRRIATEVVPTKRLNEQVRRNLSQFPEDFAFQLTPPEFDNLKSQIATSSWGGRRKPPWAFTEHGVIAAAFVVKSAIAVAVSVQVVRAFVSMRQVLASNAELAAKVASIERCTRTLDADLRNLTDAFRQLAETSPRTSRRRRIGFEPGDDRGPDRSTSRATKR